MNKEPLSKNNLKKLQGSEKSAKVNQNHIILSVLDFETTHDYISKSLNLLPTKTLHIGEKITRNKQVIRIVEENYWEYEWKNKSNNFLSDLIENFIQEILKPRIKPLKNLDKASKIRITIVQYYYSSNNLGYFFSREVLKILSEINCELDMDLYCLHED